MASAARYRWRPSDISRMKVNWNQEHDISAKFFLSRFSTHFLVEFDFRVAYRSRGIAIIQFVMFGSLKQSE